MTVGKLVVRTLVVALATFALGFVGHQLLLGRAYVAIEPIMRSKADMQSHMPFALISCLCFAGALVWIYSRLSPSASWLAQGVRFGLSVWAISTIPFMSPTTSSSRGPVDSCSGFWRGNFLQ
jgi:hypothetical protein